MKSKIVRRAVGAFLIIASLVVCALPTNDVIAEDTKSALTDFEISGTTLLKYTGTATAVSVPDSVKIIADEAFSGNSYMKSVSIPSSVEKISYAAFNGCLYLEKVVLPDSVEEIGTAAFCNCSSLNSFTMGKGVKTLGTGVFTGCNKLSAITTNDRFLCDDGVIYNKDKTVLYEVLPNAYKKVSGKTDSYELLTSFSMPNSVTSIKPYAFYGCKNIKDIILSSNLTEIPAYSFSFCNGISSIKIPMATTIIDMKAFENCVNLSDVEMPVTVSYIHATAFDGCSKLNIIAPEGSYAYEWFKDFDTSDINIIDNEDNNSSTSEDEELSYEPYEPVLPEGMIGETVIVGRQAVFFINNSDFTVNKGPESSEESSADGYSDYSEIVSDMQNVLQTETNGKGLSLPKFAVVEDGIAGKAFYADDSLTVYEFGDGITSIGDFAFARSGLSSVSIPESVTHIGYGAFYHCEKLSTILIPVTVTEIEPYAFEKTKMLENWKKFGESDFLIVGDGILIAYKGNSTTVSIPDDVKQIGANAFRDHKEITEVSLTDNVVKIGEDAFNGCYNLNTVTGGMNLREICDRAFYGCPVNTVRIVDTVESIGLGAFSLSDTSLSDEYKVVVFQGDELPKVSYGKTATRLSNEDYRIDSLEGVNVAVVNSESVNRVGTVLDRDLSGFSGLICVITTKNDSYFNGTLKIIDCTLTKDEAAFIEIPTTVYLYGKGYNFIKEELKNVLEAAKSGSYFEEKEKPETVSFSGSQDEYVLNITKDSSTDTNIKAAYKRIYGDTLPGNLTTYDISLVKFGSDINITKFGKQTLDICLKLPDNMPTSNLHIITIDENNQLEDLPYEVVTDNDRLYVKFSISHTGKYGLYSFDSSSVSLYNLDESPDTGDGIHPKWYLALGLFSLGVAFLLVRPKEKAIINSL